MRIDVASSEQVTRYLARYRQVLVTNLRQFILMGNDPTANRASWKNTNLAENEKAFWATAAHPRKTNELTTVRFTEYLKRVMLHAAPLDAPEDVAFFLASYAREALARIELRRLEPLIAVRTALEEALGMKFEGKKGEHFFRSSARSDTVLRRLFRLGPVGAQTSAGFQGSLRLESQRAPAQSSGHTQAIL